MSLTCERTASMLPMVFCTISAPFSPCARVRSAVPPRASAFSCVWREIARISSSVLVVSLMAAACWLAPADCTFTTSSISPTTLERPWLTLPVRSAMSRRLLVMSFRRTPSLATSWLTGRFTRTPRLPVATRSTKAV